MGNCIQGQHIQSIMNFLCMKFFGILSIIYAVTATPESETRVKRQSLTVVEVEVQCTLQYTVCVTVYHFPRRAMATNCFDKCCGENLCGRKGLWSCIGGLRRLLNENFTDMDNSNNNNTITTTI